MRLQIANYQPNRIGGGWTFANYLEQEFGQDPDGDIYFIAGPTMVQRDEVDRAKAEGKKIVLRIDNAVRNSRNRNTGMSRMKDFAQMADLVIYQSQWAKDYLMPFTKVDGPVILNGADPEMFAPREKMPGTYMYSRQNRDETKNWEVARYWFGWCPPPAKLYIVGNFSPELVEGNFDFYQGEDFEFIPSLTHRNYAKILCTIENFIYTYYNDACSNSLIEARLAGCKIIDPHHFLETGGASEIMACEDLSIQRMFKEYRRELERL